MREREREREIKERKRKVWFGLVWLVLWHINLFFMVGFMEYQPLFLWLVLWHINLYFYVNNLFY